MTTKSPRRIPRGCERKVIYALHAFLPASGLSAARALGRGRSLPVRFAFYVGMPIVGSPLAAVFCVSAVISSRLFDFRLSLLAAILIGSAICLLASRHTVCRLAAYRNSGGLPVGGCAFAVGGLVWSAHDLDRVLGGHIEDMEDRLARLPANSDIFQVLHEAWRCRLLMACALLALAATEISRRLAPRLR